MFSSRPSLVLRARKRPCRRGAAPIARSIDRVARGRTSRRGSTARDEARRDGRARAPRSIDRAIGDDASFPHAHHDVRANLEHRHPRERPRARDEALREARDRGRARRGRNRGRGRAGAGQGAMIRRRARATRDRVSGRSGGATTRASARCGRARGRCDGWEKFAADRGRREGARARARARGRGDGDRGVDTIAHRISRRGSKIWVIC